MSEQPAEQRFLDLWGEMATHWGVSRSMAQVYAVLFLSAAPLDTEAVMHRLDISRGNANTNLRNLMAWGLVRKAARPGGRRDYFEAEKDVRQLTANVVEARRQRELAPLTAALQDIVGDLPDTDEGRALHDRLTQMGDLLELLTHLSDTLLPLLRIYTLPEINALLRQAKLFSPNA